MCACTMHLELVSGDTITSVSIHVISSVGSEYKTIIKHSINLSFFMILFRFSFRPQNEKRRNIFGFHIPSKENMHCSAYNFGTKYNPIHKTFHNE